MPRPVAVGCQEVAHETSMSHQVKQKQKPFGLVGAVLAGLNVLGSLAAWTLVLSVWASAILGPFALLAAVCYQKWYLLGAMLGIYSLPHVVPLWMLPLKKGCPPLSRAMSRWVAPEGNRVVDLSQSSGLEPEPEPGTAMERQKQKRLIAAIRTES